MEFIGALLVPRKLCPNWESCLPICKERKQWKWSGNVSLLVDLSLIPGWTQWTVWLHKSAVVCDCKTVLCWKSRYLIIPPTMQPFSKKTNKNQPTYLSINFKQPKDYNLCTNIQPTNNHYTNFQLTNNQQTTNKHPTYKQTNNQHTPNMFLTMDW